MQLKPYHIIIPVLLSLLAAVLNGVGLGLFIPLAKGIASNDFSFAYTMPVLGNILSVLQNAFHIPEDSSQFILVFIIIMSSALQVVRYGLEYCARIYGAYYNGLFHKRVSDAIFKRFLSFGKLFYDRSSHGELRTTLNFSGNVLSMMQIVQRITISIFQVMSRFIIMIIISWQLAFITLLVPPMLYGVVKMKSMKIARLSKLKNEANLRIGREAFNVLSGIELVKNYAQEAQMCSRFEALQEQYRQYHFRMRSIAALSRPIQDTIVLIVFIAIILLGSGYLTALPMEEITLLLLFLHVAKGAMPFFVAIGESTIEMAEITSPLSSVIHVFNEKGKFPIPEGEKNLVDFHSSIEFKNVNFSYTEEIPVLKDLLFSIKKGSTVALVGPSGAGKTTIVNLLLRLYDCPPKSIFIDGIDIREFSLASIQKNIAYVSQESVFFNESIRTNLLFGLERDISEKEIFETIEKARLDEFIQSLPDGLETMIGDRGVQLSGGQKQRLSIARAFIKGAGILILDEATSSLDSETEQRIQKAIDDVVVNRTAIVIAHRLSTIKNADKIVVIQSGGVAEEGAFSALIQKREIFYKLWKEQQFF